MDKAYFRRQFDYDAWANALTVLSLEQVEGSVAEPPLALMSHIFATQRIWLMRLIGETTPPKTTDVFPQYSVDECGEQCVEFIDFWKEFFKDLSPKELYANVRYKNTKGEEFTNTVCDILTHITVHSAYHRGQIATALREAGHTPAVTDFIAYARRK
ncbi:MAG: DinB family protein [Bacteroidetes bacterium]|nr:DinB family protein [Bacteroidota bacterium]